MADRELRRLSRRELLEMLLAQSRENDELRRRIEELEAQLNAREIEVDEVGNLAEAALKLNGVFEAAQAAADQYLENVRRSSAMQLALAKAEAERIRREAAKAGTTPASAQTPDGETENE